MIFNAELDEKSHEIKIVEDEAGYLITIDKDLPFHIEVVNREEGDYTFVYKGRPYQFEVENRDTHYNVLFHGKLYSVELFDQKSAVTKTRGAGEKKLSSQMPGKIVKILVSLGQTVTKGQGLVIMEAMKMENELKSLGDGVVKRIKIKEGQTVESGQDLIFLE